MEYFLKTWMIGIIFVCILIGGLITAAYVHYSINPRNPSSSVTATETPDPSNEALIPASMIPIETGAFIGSLSQVYLLPQTSESNNIGLLLATKNHSTIFTTVDIVNNTVQTYSEISRTNSTVSSYLISPSTRGGGAYVSEDRKIHIFTI